jgi:hypothetical protein
MRSWLFTTEIYVGAGSQTSSNINQHINKPDLMRIFLALLSKNKGTLPSSNAPGNLIIFK